METQRKRLLYICHDGGLYGSQQSLHLLLKHLSPERYECLVSLARPGPLADILAAYPHVRVMAHRRLQWVKHDRRALLQRVGDVLNLMLTGFLRVWWLYGVIRREQIDLVHTNSSVSLEGALAAALAGVPHVWHVRELLMEESPKFQPVLGRWLMRWVIDRYADLVLCISQAVRDQFEALANEDPERYVLLYNALEIDESPLPLRHEERQRALRTLSLQVLNLPADDEVLWVGYIGRLSEGKGFHDLLAAAGLLRARGVPVRLVVAGGFVDTAYQQRIDDLLTRTGMRPYVHLLGYREDLAPVYPCLDVLVVPSYNEPFGRVVIEAMIQGVPCVGTDSGGIPEIITDGETGLLYPTGEANALADCLADLVEAPWKLEALRQNARRMVSERFNIEAQVKALDTWYQSIIRRHQYL